MSAQTITPLPRARPSALTATRPPRSWAQTFAGAGWVKTSKSAVGMPARFIKAFAKDLLDSMRPAPRSGPKTLKPAWRRASPTPASTAASGPSTMRPSRSRLAKSTILTTSAAPIGIFRAMPPVPPLPGAQYTRSTRSDWTHFQTSACSRAPDPSTSTFTLGLLEHGLRGGRHDLAGVAPVHGFGLPSPVAAAACSPGSVWTPVRQQQIDRFVGSGVAEHADHPDRAQAVEEVVMPIVRPVDVQPLRMDHPAGPRGLEHTVFEQKLRALTGPARRPGVAGRAMKFGESPDGSQRFVKGRATRIRILVAVPSTVGPLRPQQHIDQPAHPPVLGKAEPAADRQCVAFHRSVAPFSAFDHEWLGWRSDPVEHGADRRSAGEIGRAHV